MSYYNNSGYSGNQKNLPPVPPKNFNNDISFNNNQTIIDDDGDDFNFIDPNAHIDNSFKNINNPNRQFSQPKNPNLSLNNRIIYDYDTDGEGENDTPFGTNNNQKINNNNRELAKTNEFYTLSNKSELSRHSSTKSNPFKEDPFGSKRNSALSRNNKIFNDLEEDDPNDSFNDVPIRYNTTAPVDEANANAATSLLNPYRNNKFYNNKSNTVNGGFRVDDEFAPNELRPRFINDPDQKAPPPSGFLVWRGKKIPIICYLLTIIQFSVFFAELGKMGAYTGSPVQTQPYFNPMIGPSSYLQINMGSRFVPCMISIENVTSYTSNVFPCPNSTDVSSGCPLSSLCGLSGMKQDPDGFEPNQWYRIITPIFLHAGFVHIICNMALQLMLGVDIERQIGPFLFTFIYLAAGISGNIFGANFAQNGTSSTGASGALFGIIGVNLVSFLFYTNRSQMHPKTYRKNLASLLFEIVFTLVLGLLPGLDNFSHIGGFVMGVLLSVICLKDPNFVFQERYRYQRDPTELNKSAIPARNSLNSFTPFDYDGTNPDNRNDRSQLHEVNSRIIRFLPNMKIRRQGIFMGWIVARIACGVLCFLWFYLLSVNFWRNGGGHCSWCQYLSCIPVKDWCTMGKIQLEDLGSSNNSSILILNTFIFIVSRHFKYLFQNSQNKTKQD